MRRKHRSRSKPKVDFDDNINDRDDEFNMPDGPTKSQIAKELEDRGIDGFRPRSRPDSIISHTTTNPILGFSEHELKRKRLQEEYSKYVWNGMKESKLKSRSRSRKEPTDPNDSFGYMPYQNDYSHKQRYKYSYFKYRDTDTSPPHQAPSVHRVHYKLPEEPTPVEERDYKSSILKQSNLDDSFHASDFNKQRREISSSPTNISILPTEHESPNDRERKKKMFAEELRQQMLQNEQKKQKEKEAKLNQDYRYLSESIRSNPFGKMGAGAPIRDSEGHVIANRIKLFDELAVTSFHKSFYKHIEEEQKQAYVTPHPPKSKQSDRENIAEIGLQFLEWSNQEKKRKEMQMNEWKRTLDEQTYKLRHKKEEEKRNKLQEDLRLEEKIKKDLQELNDEYERETGRKSNKRAGHSVGNENSVNYVGKY